MACVNFNMNNNSGLGDITNCNSLNSSVASSPTVNSIRMNSFYKLTNVLLLLFLVFGSCSGVSFGMDVDENEKNENQFPVYNTSNNSYNETDGDKFLYQHFIHAYHNVPDIKEAISTQNNKQMEDNIYTINTAIQNYQEYMYRLNKTINMNEENKEIQNLYQTEQDFLKTCFTKNGAEITYNLLKYLKLQGLETLFGKKYDTIKSLITNNADEKDVKDFIKVINNQQ